MRVLVALSLLHTHGEERLLHAAFRTAAADAAAVTLFISLTARGFSLLLGCLCRVEVASRLDELVVKHTTAVVIYYDRKYY